MATATIPSFSGGSITPVTLSLSILRLLSFTHFKSAYIGRGVGNTLEDLPGEIFLVFINELMRKANPDLYVKHMIGSQARMGFRINSSYSLLCIITPKLITPEDENRFHDSQAPIQHLAADENARIHFQEADTPIYLYAGRFLKR